MTERNCRLLLKVVSHRNVVYGNHVGSRFIIFLIFLSSFNYLPFQGEWLYDWKGHVPWFCMLWRWGDLLVVNFLQQIWVYFLLCKLGWQCLFSSHLVLFPVSMMHWRVERRHQQLPRHILSRNMLLCCQVRMLFQKFDEAVSCKENIGVIWSLWS